MAVALCVAACDRAAPVPEPSAAVPSPPAGPEKLIVAFGDSLYAGYGLKPGEAWPAKLEKALWARGVNARVVNAGVSGDTTAAARQRLAFVLDAQPRKPDLVAVGLGGNDMLRGLPPRQTRQDLDGMMAELKRRGIRTLIAGMVAAPNLGPAYGGDYNRIFPDLARAYRAPLYPFFLAGVAGNERLLLPDRIHPNFQGVKRMVTGIGPAVLAALKAG